MVLLPRPHRVPKLEFSPHQLLLVQKLGIAHYSGVDVFPWFQMRWQQAAQFERHLLPLTEPRSELPKDAVEQWQEAVDPVVGAGIFAITGIGAVLRPRCAAWRPDVRASRKDFGLGGHWQEAVYLMDGLA